MAWVAFDRAVQVAEDVRPRGAGRALARAARRRSTARSASAASTRERGTFTQSYGSRGLDAASLMIPLVGFLRPTTSASPARSTRSSASSTSTASSCATTPRDGRATACPPGEGAFLLCTFWLADCLALLGPHRRGDARCSSACRRSRNDVGLLAEEYDPRAGPHARQLPAGVLPRRAGQHRAEPGRRHAAPAERRPGATGRTPLMRAITVVPGTPTPPRWRRCPSRRRGGRVLVDGVALGICGTDAEIVRGDYGEAPPGSERLILGHESLGRVREAPADSGFAPGDLVVGIVRRPDPCRARRALRASGTCAATASTPSAGSRRSTATAPSAGGSSPTSPSSSIPRSACSAC